MPIINSLETPATTALQRLGAHFQIFQHNNKIRLLAQAAQERGQSPDQIVRSILFRVNQGSFLMVLMPGEKQISWRALRTYLGVRRLTTASPEEVQQITGYEIGAVSPFGLPGPLRILADPAIFTHTVISLGSGQKGYALILESKLIKEMISDLEIVSLGD